MKDAIVPIQTAAYAALLPCSYTLNSAPDVNTDYPYIYLQVDSVSPLRMKDCFGERVMLQFHCWDYALTMTSNIQGMKNYIGSVITESWRPTLSDHKVSQVLYDGSQIVRDVDAKKIQCIVTYIIDAWEK